jgi:hypothetical protein
MQVNKIYPSNPWWWMNMMMMTHTNINKIVRTWEERVYIYYRTYPSFFQNKVTDTNTLSNLHNLGFYNYYKFTFNFSSSLSLFSFFHRFSHSFSLPKISPCPPGKSQQLFFDPITHFINFVFLVNSYCWFNSISLFFFFVWFLRFRFQNFTIFCCLSYCLMLIFNVIVYCFCSWYWFSYFIIHFSYFLFFLCFFSLY